MEFNIKVKKDNEFFVSLKDIRSSKTLNISADELKENPEILKNEQNVKDEMLYIILFLLLFS